MIPAVVAAYLDKKPQVFLWVVMTYASAALVGILILMLLQYLLLKHQRKGEIEKEIEMPKNKENSCQVAKY